jgi:hypothetical protein
MRIIIEMTETESQSMTIARETLSGKTAALPLGAATDGGQPSHALLLALGSKPQAGAGGLVADAGGADAGQPAAWLLDAVPGGERLM